MNKIKDITTALFIGFLLLSGQQATLNIHENALHISKRQSDQEVHSSALSAKLYAFDLKQVDHLLDTMAWELLEDSARAEANQILSLRKMMKRDWKQTQLTPQANAESWIYALQLALIAEHEGKNAHVIEALHIAIEQVELDKRCDPKWQLYLFKKLGTNYMFKMSDHQAAMHWFEKEQQLRQQLNDESKSHVINLYHLAIAYRSAHNYEKALSYCIRAEQFLNKGNIQAQRLSVLVNAELGNIYRFTKDIQRFQQHYEIALQQAAKLKSPEGTLFQLRDNYGRNCLRLGLIDKAIEMHELMRPYIASSSDAEIRYLEMKAVILREQDSMLKAIAAQQEAIEICKLQNQVDSLKHSTLLTNLADLYQRNDQHERAIACFFKSLKYQLGASFDPLHPNPFADNAYFLSGGYEYELIPLAKSLAQTNVEFGGNVNSRTLALKYYDLLENIFDQISESKEEAEVLRDLEQFQEVFGDALGLIAKCLEEQVDEDLMERAFRYMEKSQSVILNKYLSAQRVAVHMGIPQPLLSKWNEFKTRKALLEQRLVKANSAQQFEINESLQIMQKKQGQIQNQIEKYQPNFFNGKRESSSWTLDETQTYLSNGDKGLLQFHSSSDALVAMMMYQDEVKLHAFENTDEIKNQIDQFRNLIAERPSLLGNDSKDWAQVAHQLYVNLMEDILDVDKIESLIIIPDGILADLPFEPLLVTNENTANGNYDFLINALPISYANSVDDLLSVDLKKKKGMFSFFAYGTSGNSNDEYLELPGTATESAYIREQIFNKAGNYFSGNKASKSNFLKVSASSSLLHLSIHAQSDSTSIYNSKLVFADDRTKASNYLFAHEISMRSIPADLVVLSACESGMGKAKAGEGVYSLARAFKAAGASSIIMSLWDLDDQAAKKMNIAFYQEAKKGKDFNNCLREAKLQYLDQSNVHFCHPYYWASSVLSGKVKNQLFG